MIDVGRPLRTGGMPRDIGTGGIRVPGPGLSIRARSGLIPRRPVVDTRSDSALRPS